MQKDQASCPCRRTRCPRHGDCAACRAHHAGKKHAPACDRACLRPQHRRDNRGDRENG
jgi:hypothetical protein